MASPTPPVAASTTFDFGRAFTFVKEDPDAVKKILIGGVFALLTMVIVGAFFVAGYLVRLIQRAARGELLPLPDWDDFGGLFADGAKLVGAYLIYTLGLYLILGCPFGLLVIIAGAGSGRHGGGGLELLAGLGMVALYGVLLLGGLIIAIYLPAAFVRLALSGEFRAAFQVSENVAFIRRNLLNYALSLVLYLIGAFIAQLGILLCCVGIFPLSFWGLCMFGWALGETARRDAVLRPPQPGAAY
jgi:uncharacterized BrkB/YihY/UPF0761 family membrane protein